MGVAYASLHRIVTGKGIPTASPTLTFAEATGTDALGAEQSARGLAEAARRRSDSDAIREAKASILVGA